MIVEIAGVTGTGKSTIVNAITQHNPAIRTDYHLSWWQFLPAYYARAVLAIPRYLVRYRGKGSMFWQVLQWMTYVDRLHQSLSRFEDDTLILLDQGPLYWLTFFNIFVPEYVQEEWFARWWAQKLKDWASVLDVIFFLECDDAVLIERVRNRSKKHRLQSLSDIDARKFLADYRKVYRAVITELTVDDGPTVHYLSAEQESPECITRRILIGLLDEQ